MVAMKVAPPITEQPVKQGYELNLMDRDEIAIHHYAPELIVQERNKPPAKKYPPTVNRPQERERFHQLIMPLQAEAADLGLPALDDNLVKELYRVLATLDKVWAGRGFTYLVPDDGSVVIDIRGTRPDGVVIWIKPDMSVYCSGEKAGETWNQPDCALDEFPGDDFLQKIKELRVEEAIS